MIPIIKNKDFEKIGMVEDYFSFIWTSRYYNVGDFEIVVPADDTHIDLLQRGFYVTREDDEHAGIIEDIEITLDEDQNEQMIVTGRFLSAILARRIIAVQTQLYGTVSSGVNTLITDAIISPTIPARKISNFYVSPSDFEERLEAQYTGKNLLETIEDICQTTHLGFKTVLDGTDFVFSLFSGVDRSFNQSENPRVIFSDEYDNLLSSTYQYSGSDIVTDVLVAGEGEGLDRKTVWASRDNPSGLDRYEAYHDQRNLSTNDGEISETEYNQQMLEEGLEQLTTITQAFDGTVYFDNTKYREDVYIGDVVTIQNKKWGVYINSRIVEVIESVDEAGTYSIVPTFGV